MHMTEHMRFDDIIPDEHADIEEFLSHMPHEAHLYLEDVLDGSAYADLPRYLDTRMKEVAGTSLTRTIYHTFPRPATARVWFYSENTALGMRPYDACLRNEYSRVGELIRKRD